MLVSCDSSMMSVLHAGHARLVLRRHEQIVVGGLAEIERSAGVRVDDGDLVGGHLRRQRRRVGDRVFGIAGKIGRQTLGPIQGDEIDRGRRGAAGRRQQRLWDRNLDAFAIAGEAVIERRPAVERRRDAGGRDRIQKGLKRGIGAVGELHLILGTNVGERQIISGRVILIRIQIDCGAWPDDRVRRGGRVDADHVSIAECRVVNEGAVDLIPCRDVRRICDDVGRRPIRECPVERDQVANRNWRGHHYHRRGVGDGVLGNPAETARQSRCAVIDEGGEIDRGRRGAAGRRQQRLRDRQFDTFAIAGHAVIERRAIVKQGRDAGGSDRIQIGLQHAIGVGRELHVIFGAYVAERAITGRRILICIQVDESICGDDRVRRGSRVYTDHISLTERRVVEESTVGLISCDGIRRRHNQVSHRPIREYPVERDQVANRNWRGPPPRGRRWCIAERH